MKYSSGSVTIIFKHLNPDIHETNAWRRDHAPNQSFQVPWLDEIILVKKVNKGSAYMI